MYIKRIFFTHELNPLVDVVCCVRDNGFVPIEINVSRVSDFTERYVANIFANAEDDVSLAQLLTLAAIWQPDVVELKTKNAIS